MSRPLVAALVVGVCIGITAPALARTTSGDNSLSGGQSGHSDDTTAADGATIVNVDSTSGGGGSPADGVHVATFGVSGHATFTRSHVDTSAATAEPTVSADSPRGPLGPMDSIRPDVALRDWRFVAVQAPTDEAAATSTTQVRHHHGDISIGRGDVSTGEVSSTDPQLSGSTRALHADTAGLTEDSVDVRGQVAGPSGPPGPVGPPSANGLVTTDSGPAADAAVPTIAPAPVQTHAPPAVPARSLPINGAETARLALIAVCMLAVGVALNAAARIVARHSRARSSAAYAVSRASDESVARLVRELDALLSA
jgi:hypothetical protein